MEIKKLLKWLALGFAIIFILFTFAFRIIGYLLLILPLIILIIFIFIIKKRGKISGSKKANKALLVFFGFGLAGLLGFLIGILIGGYMYPHQGMGSLVFGVLGFLIGGFLGIVISGYLCEKTQDKFLPQNKP